MGMGSGGDELWLPELVIERIQYFLDTKEAAQTTILSKPWYNVWLLRPNVDFDHSHHLANYYNNYKYGQYYPEEEEANKLRIYDQGMEQFLEFAYNTLKRYEKSNLKIDRLNLCMRCIFHYHGEWDYGLLHTELILRALKIGVTHLTLRVYGWGYVLPDEVFEFAENLTLEMGNINPKPMVTAASNSRLRSLCLDSIEFKTPDTISHIISSCCPLIQNVSLYHISLEKPNDFYHQGQNFGGYYENYPTHDVGYITKPLMGLTTLVLKDVYFDMLFLGDLSSKFPFLKDLTLFMALKKYQEEIRISSTSLEHLDFKLKNIGYYTRYNHPYKRQRVTFDFPSIRKFTYAGSVIPLMSSQLKSSNSSTGRMLWESHLSITRRYKPLTTSWFRRLGDFLSKLRRSRVYLSLHVQSVLSFDYEVGDIRLGLKKRTTQIENLIIDHQQLPSLTFYALLDGLFRICHPKLITQCVSTCFRLKKKHIELLGHLLLSNEKTSCLRGHFMYGLNNLKEARAHIIDTCNCREDDDVPLGSLLQHLKTSAKDKQEVRFRLNWEPTKMYQQNRDSVPADIRGNYGPSPIYIAKSDSFSSGMAKQILERCCSGEYFMKMKQLLKSLMDDDDVDDANEFSDKLHGYFRDPSFVGVLRSIAERENRHNVVPFWRSDNYSPTERMTRMKKDPNFRGCLMNITSVNTLYNTLRAFLVILIGYWFDISELAELHKRMGFRDRLENRADYYFRVKALEMRTKNLHPL